MDIMLYFSRLFSTIKVHFVIIIIYHDFLQRITYSCMMWIIIIIYHDFLPPPWRGSHFKWENTHTIIKIHPLTHIPDTWALIFSSCSLFTVFPQPHHVTASLPSPCDIHQSTGGRSERTQCQAKNGRVKLIQLDMYQGSPLFLIFPTVASTVIPLFPKATFTPSI